MEPQEHPFASKTESGWQLLRIKSDSKFVLFCMPNRFDFYRIPTDPARIGKHRIPTDSARSGKHRIPTDPARSGKQRASQMAKARSSLHRTSETTEK
jgi:hypothetical protein